jgi:hypothetical protein
MPLQLWRRFHGTNIVTQVASIDGAGVARLEASTWLASDPTVLMLVPRRFVDLARAQSEADAFARKSFDHWCDVSTCGEWTQWPGAHSRHDAPNHAPHPRPY